MPDERGILLEHLVAYEIHRRKGTPWPDLELFHFRTKHGVEVDFLLRSGRETWAIEVKSARRLSGSMLGGLRRVRDHLPRVDRRILVFLGERAQRVDDIEVLPLEKFLGMLPSRG